MKKKQIPIRTRLASNLTLADVGSRKNLVTETTNAQREQRAVYLANEGLANFAGLVDDMTITLIEAFYEEYSNTPMYKSDKTFKALLDRLNAAAKDSYDFFVSLTKDRELFSDLRDGAQEYFFPIFNEAFNNMQTIYKCSSKIKYTKLSAILSVLWCVVEVGRQSTEGLVGLIQRNAGVKLGGVGIERYRMMKEHDIMAELMDKYCLRYPNILKPSVDVVINSVGDALLPVNLAVAAGRYAIKYNPNSLQYYQQVCKNVFGIKFTMK